jgi:hypothetical protein
MPIVIKRYGKPLSEEKLQQIIEKQIRYQERKRNVEKDPREPFLTQELDPNHLPEEDEDEDEELEEFDVDLKNLDEEEA